MKARLTKHPLQLRRYLLLSSLLFAQLVHNSIAAEQPTAVAPKTAASTAPPAVSKPLPNTNNVPPAPESDEKTKAQIAPLEQTFETFITSEEIDTDKAVDFPTNI
jgi:hypothetical protein